MANPYSQYTGTRISAVPTGYLSAAQASAEGVRKSGERMGDMIGAGIAKYYEGKQEDEDKEKLADLAASFAYKTDDEGRVPSVGEPDVAVSDEDVSTLRRREVGDELKRAMAKANKVGPESDEYGGLVKKITQLGDLWKSLGGTDENLHETAPASPQGPTPAYTSPQGGEGEAPQPAARYAQSPKEPRSLQDKYDYLNESLQQFLSNREDMSPETFREGLKMYQSEKKQVTDQHRWEAEEKRLGAVKSGAGTPADLLRFDKMQSLPWYKKLDNDQRARFDQEFFDVAEGVATPTAKLQEWQAMKNEAWFKDADDDEKARQGKQFFSVDKDAEPTPAEIQRFNAMKTADFYVNADEDERARIEAAFFKVETPEATLARRQKEVADKGNREAFVALLREQGRLPKGVIDKFALAKTSAAMDMMYDNLSDEDKGNMPADARTWAAIKSGFPANTPPDEIEKYRRIHWKLEEREVKSANEKEMAAFVLINNDPTKTQEEKIRAGYMYGVYSGPETARRYYEDWESKHPSATDEDKDEKRALLGLPTGVEADLAQVKLELDEKRLAAARKVEAAIAAGSSGVQTMAIPGTTSHKFVKMPDQDHWTLINIGTGAAAAEPVTQADRDKMNADLENAGISYRWVEDPTAASGSRYSSMGGFNLMRQYMGEGTGISPSTNTSVIPIGNFTGDGPKNEPIGNEFSVGGKKYKRVEGGAIEIR